MKKHIIGITILTAAILASCVSQQEGKQQTESRQTESRQTESPQTESPRTENLQTESPQTESPQTESPPQTTPSTEETVRFYRQDGKDYELVPDLVTGEYLWASAVTQGKPGKDIHGHERPDYNTQERSFEHTDGQQSLPVRRWDNLLYSAGDYLIFEYNGIIHVSRSSDLYHPVLSYDAGATHGIITKVPEGYMTADSRSYEIRFYDMQFKEIKTVSGYRAGESGHYYADGRMAVRDMNTGLMGFLDQTGEFAIPCQYAAVSDFSNGYASVLTNAEIIPYTEDGGAISMFYGKGGEWGIIDQTGRYVLEPSPQYANESSAEAEMLYYNGIRRFGPVREDGTVDFIASDQDEEVIETVKLQR